MWKQPRVDGYDPSEIFADGRAARPPVAGTVARGHLDEDDLMYRGTENGKPATRFPFAIDGAGLRRGRERYDIYCAPCHAPAGTGDGMIVQRGFSAPPSFHSQALREKPEGHYFDVITHGFGVMPGYAAQIPVRDRWLITAYVRALQLSRRVPAAALSAADRAELEAGGRKNEEHK